MSRPALALVLLLALACCRGAPAPVPRDYQEQVERWRRERLARLKGDGGWLRLAGLFWLDLGTWRVGSDPSADIVLPSRAPKVLGTLDVVGSDGALLRVSPGVRATIKGKPVSERVLASDAAPRGPDRVRVGDFTVLLIRRSGRLALRLFDDRAGTLRRFSGLDYFPIEAGWRITSRLRRFPVPRRVQVATVIKTTEEMTAPGELLFLVQGRPVRLVPFAEQGSRELFIVFGDRTNGRDTYGGGRFLQARLAEHGDEVVLDFNQAYNPPCSFTRYATCPVPRRENRLQVSITAGEKAYRGH